MNIRLEQPQDYREVENLTREAFWNIYRPGCTEHYVLNQYRSNPDFIPELDLVMEHDGIIIGHIMFSKAKITLDNGTDYPSWTFGPISIHPLYKRKGHGLKLLQYALEKARTKGIGMLTMEGNIDFYRHAGFDLASKMRIHYHDEPRDSAVPYFLAQELIPGYWGDREGTYRPPQGYFVADQHPEAFQSYDKSFPPKAKAFNESQLPPYSEKAKLVMSTQRLLLRPWMESDADMLYKYASDPEVGPRAGWSPHQNVAESLEIIRKHFLNDHTWAVELNATHEIIGCIGYLPPSSSNLPLDDHQCEVGYWVARPYWNQGICSEALQKIVDHCFAQKGFTQLWGDYFTDNPASGRVMEKCGFVATGRQTHCPKLAVGSERPVNVMCLEIKG